MINIALNGLTFRCLEDSNGSDHTYPRTTDPAYQQNLKITEYTATTITVNVGISSNTTLHTFQSAITDCVTAPGDCTNVKDAIDNFNKKALYIMIREMTDVQTSKITQVSNVFRKIYPKIQEEMLTKGHINNLHITGSI